MEYNEQRVEWNGMRWVGRQKRNQSRPFWVNHTKAIQAFKREGEIVGFKEPPDCRRRTDWRVQMHKLGDHLGSCCSSLG